MSFDGCVLIRLPSGLCTLIDAADLDVVQMFYWNSHPANQLSHYRLKHYVSGSVEGGSIHLHRFLCYAPPGLVIDHINGDGLDNRRSVNLRAVTRSENGKNRVRGPSPLSLGILPRGVPIVPLRKMPTPMGFSRAVFEAGGRL